MKGLQLSNILGISCIYLFLLSYSLGSGLFFGLPFAFFKAQHAIFVMITIILFYRIRLPFEFNGAFEIKLLRKNRLIDFCQSLQPWYSVHTSHLDYSKNKKYMFVCSPHGMFPISWLFFIFQLANIGIYPLALMADVIFRLPYTREVSCLLGGVNASWKSVKIAAQNKRSLILIPGSTREMKYSRKFKDTIILVRRTGFIKAALEYGYSLVPVLGVGVDELYRPYVFEWEWYKRMFGHYLFFALGKYEILYPKRTEIHNIIGRPIDVIQNENPSERDVQMLSDEFYQGLENALESYNVTNKKNIKLLYVNH